MQGYILSMPSSLYRQFKECCFQMKVMLVDVSSNIDKCFKHFRKSFKNCLLAFFLCSQRNDNLIGFMAEDVCRCVEIDIFFARTPSATGN